MSEERCTDHYSEPVSDCVAPDLRARLAEVEAERDRRHEYWLTAQARAYAAEARLAAVEALCEAHGKINGLWDEHAMTYVRMVRAALRGEDEK